MNGPAISPIQGIPRGILSDRHSWSIIPGKPMPTIMRSRGQDKPVAGSVGATRTVNRTPPRRVLAAIQPRSAMVTSFSRREASLQSADTAKSMAANREGLSASVAVTVVDTWVTAAWGPDGRRRLLVKRILPGRQCPGLIGPIRQYYEQVHVAPFCCRAPCMGPEEHDPRRLEASHDADPPWLI